MNESGYPMLRFRPRGSSQDPPALLTEVLPAAPRVGALPVAPPERAPVSEPQRQLIGRTVDRLARQLGPTFDREVRDAERLHTYVASALAAILDEERITLPDDELQRLQRLVEAEMVGFGPLHELLADETISEIMVNGPQLVFVERAGRLQRAAVQFNDDAHVRRIIDRIVAPLGRRVNESSPMVDARLPDGSRVNVIVPPLILNGPTITIRKFASTPLTPDDLVRFGSLSAEAMAFLRACVLGHTNVVVTGGTGTGKTTLLNVLSSFIPDDERIITIENAAELQLQQEHVLTLESRPANIEGKNEVTIRDLVINALRMRPNRIVIGECRSGETLDMLQAMNTGHDGSMTTIHANNPRDAMGRLETMVLMSGMQLPTKAIRGQIAAALQLVVHVDRSPDGSRRVSKICEVTGMEGDVITMSDIFVFRQDGVQNGRVVGQLAPTGIRPRLLAQLARQDITVPTTTFGFAPAARS